MWRTVFSLEFRILKRDRAALGVLAIFSSFLILAAMAGGRYADSLDSGLSRSQQSHDAQLSELKQTLKTLKSTGAALAAKDPRDAVWMGKDGGAQLAILPPSPLAAVAVGQRDLHPQAVRITTDVHLTQERETETPMTGPTRLMTGAFDPAFLFVVLFPLVVIALSYELLSGERERGTLAMLLSQPVSQSALVTGKAAARAVALCGVTLIFAILGLLIAGADIGNEAAMTHIALYAAILITWALFWLAAAIAVNAWSQSSAQNALMLVGLWLLVVVVIPGLVNAGVNSLYPPPSRVELMHEAREATQDANKQLDDMTGKHDTKPKAKDFAQRVAEVQEELANRSAPVIAELREKLQQRHELTSMLRYLSPAMVIQLALEDVAGSGAVRHQRFEAQVEKLHESYRRYFLERIRAGKHLDASDLQQIPELKFEEEPKSTLVWRVGQGILSLLLMALIFIGLARPRLREIGRLTR